jgi:hypothetical protein
MVAHSENANSERPSFCGRIDNDGVITRLAHTVPRAKSIW